VPPDEDDPFELERFVKAQERDFADALAELRAGRKRSHWMWYVFPQMRGLGVSQLSRTYGITGLDEARAYLDHPVLGPRLRESVGLLLTIEGASARDIFGSPDDLKLRSSATLFACASGPGSPFAQVLAKYFGGVPDSATLRLLESPSRK
jgi:uncharacterized protein (DUF1810 family)